MSKQYKKLNQEPRPSSLFTIKREPLPPKRKASTPKSTPKIFATNVRSITNTKHAQLVRLSVDYDIMLISESWLQPHKKQAYSIPNFQLHSVERTRRRAGGVCIFVRNSFAVTVVNEYTSENVSALWICMHNENEPATIYASIYHPPNLKRAVCDQTIDYMISTVSDLASNHPNAKFLIYGDFNDLDMTPFEDVVSLTQLVWFPTRGQNKLDLVYTDITEYSEDPHKTCQSEPNVGRSDHSSIEISTSFSPKPKYETIQRRVVTEKSKIEVTNKLHLQNWDAVLNTSDPNDKASLFQQTVANIVDEHCPVRSIRVPVGKTPITTPLITKLRRAKKSAFRKKCPSWKFLSALFKSKLQELQQTRAVDNINSIAKGSKAWWNGVKEVTGERKTDNNTEYVNVDNSWLTSQEFCDQINNHYLSLGEGTTLDFPNLPLSEPDHVYNLDELQIYNLLRKINTKKSTHSLDFPSWVSRNNADILAKPVTNILMSILNTGIFPKIWKQAEVKPLAKVANPKLFKDYRPIALLFHLSKIAEVCVKTELAKYIPTDEHQFAYTKGYGTSDALVKIITDTAITLNEKQTYAMQSLLLDFSKAFDLMKPDTLATKLLNMNVPVSVVRLVMSFLTERRQRVRFNNQTSPSRHTNLGVPQGTILGPILWNAYVQDLKPSERVIKYADDTTIYVPVLRKDIEVTTSERRNRSILISHNAMQVAADRATSWCENTNQKINATKTQFLMFSLQLNITVSPPIMIKSEQVEQTNSAKLLGVVIDDHLKFQEHSRHIIQRTRQPVHGLLTLKRHGVKPTSLVKFYQARIIPIMTYAAPAWYSFTAQHVRDTLERHQSLCLRLIYPNISSYTERLRLSGVERLNDCLNNLCAKYTERVANDQNHRLHHLIPPTQSVNRHSARLSDVHILKSRTALLSKSLFHSYL